MAKPKVEWKDAATHRKPDWPLMGYAPGDYLGRCIKCGESHLWDMDKRAYHCLPCAVDAAMQTIHRMEVECRQLKEENDTLRAAIAIVSTPPKEQ